MNGTETETMLDSGDRALSEALDTSFRLLRFVLILALMAYALSGVFVVRQHEKAFVLIFGKISGIGDARIREPGIHWTLPRPFSRIWKIPAERVQTLEVSSFPGSRPEPDPLGEEYALTGDANLTHSAWALRYTVSDPEAWLFRFSRLDEVLTNELNHAIVKTSARFPIDSALRTEIEAFRGEVDSELRRRTEELGLGIRIERIDILAMSPPRQVAAAFDSVVAAEQEASREITAARSDAGRILNEARGEAARLVSEGEAERMRFVSEVKADAVYFEKVHEKYIQNPQVTMRTLLQDSLRRTLAGVDEKYVIHNSGVGKQELRIQLGPAQKQTGASR